MGATEANTQSIDETMQHASSRRALCRQSIVKDSNQTVRMIGTEASKPELDDARSVALIVFPPRYTATEHDALSIPARVATGS